MSGPGAPQAGPGGDWGPPPQLLGPDQVPSVRAHIKSEDELANWARRFAAAIPAPQPQPSGPGLTDLFCVALSGPMGAGKTALARAVLQALGHGGEVTSPTFPLAQSYDIAPPLRQAWHLDLFRLQGPQEVQALGTQEMREPPASLWLVEWPDRASPEQLAADLWIALQPGGDDPQARQLRAWPCTPRGQACLEALSA